MAFRFSLATVLRAKESAEKREERALQQAQLDHTQSLRTIEALTAELDKKDQLIASTMRTLMPACEATNLLQERNAVLSARQQMQESEKTLRDEVAKRMSAYQAVRRDREILSNMREDRHAEYRREQDRNQQKMLDDIYSARSSRS